MKLLNVIKNPSNGSSGGISVAIAEDVLQGVRDCLLSRISGVFSIVPKLSTGVPKLSTGVPLDCVTSLSCIG